MSQQITLVAAGRKATLEQRIEALETNIRMLVEAINNNEGVLEKCVEALNNYYESASEIVERIPDDTSTIL